MTDYFSLVVAKPGVAYAAKQGGGTIANVYEIDQLEPGALAIFTLENQLITAVTPASALVGVQQFYMVVGSAAPNTLGVKTPPIDRDAFHQLKTAYAPPVTQVSAVGREAIGGTGLMNVPALISAGDIFLLTVVDNRDGQFQSAVNHRYEYIAKSGDGQEQIVDGLIALVNGKSSSIVTAAKVTDGAQFGLTLTAKELDITFETLVSENLESATVNAYGSAAATPGPFRGNGTLAVLTELERHAQITSRGRTNEGGQSHLWWRQPSELATFGGTDFVTYAYKWATEMFSGMKIQNKAVNQVLVAIATGDALVAVYDTILGIILQDPTTSAGSSPEGEFSD